MKQNAWLEQHHFDTINQWSLDECFTLLFMSETMQRKLPGASTAKCAKQRLKERLTELFSQASSMPITHANNSSAQEEITKLHRREHLLTAVINLLRQVLQSMAPKLELDSFTSLISTEVTKDQLKEILMQVCNSKCIVE